MKKPFTKRFTLVYPRTAWVVLLSLLSVLYTGILTIGRSWFGCATRQWVDGHIQRWTHFVLGLAKVRYQVFNPHGVTPPPNRPVILMCNHSSAYDIPLSFLAFPKASVRMLAKKELFSIPTMGGGMRAAEFACIDRHNRQQAIKDLQDVKKILESGIMLWIAPEGTRSHDGKLGPFKKGGFITAIDMQAIIIPMGIRGANHILPARSFQLNLNQAVEIHIGQPVDAGKYTLEEREQLIQTVRNSMLKLVGEV